MYNHFCLTLQFDVVTNHLARSTLRKKQFILVHCLSVYSIIVGIAVGGWSHCIYAPSGSNFLLFIPDYGMVLPTSRAGWVFPVVRSLWKWLIDMPMGVLLWYFKISSRWQTWLTITPGMVVHTFGPSLRSLWQLDLCEFDTRLVHIGSSRLARAAEWKLVWKTKEKEINL